MSERASERASVFNSPTPLFPKLDRLLLRKPLPLTGAFYVEQTVTLQWGTGGQVHTGGKSPGPPGQHRRGRQRAGPARCQATGGAAEARREGPQPSPCTTHSRRACSTVLCLSLCCRPAQRDHGHLVKQTRIPFVAGQQPVSGKVGMQAQARDRPLLRGGIAGVWVWPGARKASGPPPPAPLAEATRGQVTTVTTTCARDFPGGSMEQGPVAEWPESRPAAQMPDAY